MKYLLTINLEEQTAIDATRILETIEVADFETEAEARECLDQILTDAGLEDEEEADALTD